MTPQRYWCLDLDLLESRDVVGHMTIRRAVADFLSVVTMSLSSTVLEIWSFEVLRGGLFQEQRSVIGRSSILH